MMTEGGPMISPADTALSSATLALSSTYNLLTYLFKRQEGSTSLSKISSLLLSNPQYSYLVMSETKSPRPIEALPCIWTNYQTGCVLVKMSNHVMDSYLNSARHLETEFRNCGVCKEKRGPRVRSPGFDFSWKQGNVKIELKPELINQHIHQKNEEFHGCKPDAVEEMLLAEHFAPDSKRAKSHNISKSTW
ncbi:hypothetical protein H6P81_012344 [Aristolochia fimbriata]|uniref:Uncharacterized protein n=1 Tax=Aristolochia fimbriata TaxID=158543 RepID=A0AAV7EEB7_ARIFI|nr:hypothetical protein H6P81_012344 [Aristolochia fimbriata]